MRDLSVKNEVIRTRCRKEEDKSIRTEAAAAVDHGLTECARPCISRDVYSVTSGGLRN